MSDFYTKKQKKFWCDKCRIFIEYNKGSIEKHNSSRNHANNIASEGKYNSIKKKYANYVTELHEANNSQNKEEGHTNEINSNKTLGRKVKRNNINEQCNRESTAYLKEIKNEIMKDQLIAMKNSKPEDQRKKAWGVFWDQTYSLPYYYNFLSGASVWEMPSDYDGDQEDINKAISDNINSSKTKPILQNDTEGAIGKFEIVEESKSVFGKRTEIKENNEKEGE